MGAARCFSAPPREFANKEGDDYGFLLFFLSFFPHERSFLQRSSVSPFFPSPVPHWSAKK